MDKKNKQEITLDDIARILQNGLLKMDKGFNDVDKRFNDVDKRFDRVEERLASVENKIDRIEGEIIKKVDTVEYNTTKYRVKKLEEKFA